MRFNVLESVLFWLSRKLLARRHATLAMLCGKALLRLKPSSAKGFDIIARSHFFHGNYYETASTLCKGLLSLKPERLTAYEVLSRSSGTFENNIKSYKHLAKVIEFYLCFNQSQESSVNAGLIVQILNDVEVCTQSNAYWYSNEGRMISQGDQREYFVDQIMKDLNKFNKKEYYWSSIEGRMILKILILCYQEAQRYDDVIRLCTALLQDRRQECGRKRSDVLDIGWYAIRASAFRELGQYDEALKEYENIVRIDPIRSRHLRLHLQTAFLWGLKGRAERAVKAFSDQWRLSQTRSKVSAVSKSIYRIFQKEANHLNFQGMTAVLFEGSTTAFGHVVLDPFHAYNLAISESDQLVLVIPPVNRFGPSMHLPLALHAQVMTLLPTEEQMLLDLCWLELGKLRYNNLTFIVHNYWSLNRQIFEARSNPTHPLSKSRQYLKLPHTLDEQGIRLCEHHGIDLNRPIVVVHTREQNFHNLNEQSFRNVDFDNYLPALEQLNDNGYQIVRIGDKYMHSIRRRLPDVLELPFIESNAQFLDAFFISRCDFMISCQSGPCSIARVMGKPTLVLNAVYHHTLIPESQELIAFKTYYQGSNKSRKRLSAKDIFALNLDHIDKASQLAAKDIHFEDLTSGEIASSVEEMQHWLTTPSIEESTRQSEFRKLLIEEQERRREKGDIDWYIGYSLPQCRLSDSVNKLQITSSMSIYSPRNKTNINLVHSQ